jgi:chemotaxis protein MotB
MSDGHGGGGGKKRRGHEEEHEEHENHERWLVSYADMMTLLMVLFIVMFAISQVDQKKFMALKTGLSSGFGAPVSFLNGADQMLDPGGAVTPDSPNLAGAAGAKTRSATMDATQQVNPEAVAQLVTKTNQAQVAKEVENLKKAQERIAKALQKAGMAKNAAFRFDERGLVITIATDKVLFQSGSADLQLQGRRILDAIAPTLLRLPNRISVDGHTNSIPISSAQFPSNWELSGDRASGVLRYLMRVHRLPPDRMSATGFADTHPLLPSSDPRSVEVNRRVEIVVVARVDDSAGRAVAALGNNEKTGTTSSGSTSSGSTSSGPASSGTASSAGATAGTGSVSPGNVTGLGGVPYSGTTTNRKAGTG